MFKGMYGLIQKSRKKPLSEKIALQRDATPILSPEELLATEKRQQILQDIRSLLNLSDEEYDEIFLSVIHQFAAFVQNLPETERSYYSSLGGMLEHGLERASLSLFLCRTYLLPEGATLSSLSEDEMLWAYAVFTAALLFDVGRVATKHIITLSDEAGNSLKSWLPYSGAMIGQATHYIFGFSEEPYEHMRRLITPLLARQILDMSIQEENQAHIRGFNWIASNPEVLESWLAILSDDVRQVGSLLTVIPLADTQLLESYFTDKKIFRHSLSPQIIAFLNKLNKQRKEFQQKLKELREKMLQDNTATHIKERLGESNSPENKTAKQSLFGFPSLSQQDRLASAAIKSGELSFDTMKHAAEQFTRWVKEGVTQGKFLGSTVLIEGTKVLLTQQLLQQFLNEHKKTVVGSLSDLQKSLTETDVARPLTSTEVLTSPLMVSSMSHILVAQNSGLILPSGIAQIITPAAQTQVQVPEAPQKPTASEEYASQQQKQQQQQTLFNTIRITVPGQSNLSGKPSDISPTVSPTKR